MTKTLWGIHMPKSVGSEPIDCGFIGLGWERLGDISTISASRDAFKNLFLEVYPEEKLGAVPVKAGISFRFVHEMDVGDGVIYPSKHDRMVNLGYLTGQSSHFPNSTEEALTNRRNVEWVAHIPRAEFSQSALNEIGSIITLFKVANNADEFWAAFSGENSEPQIDDLETAVAVTEQVEENTNDFVIKRLKNVIGPTEFEEFAAHLLRAMGYHARVTKRSGDGNVDVIAHRDELGFEPPIIKVQCKQTLERIGRPQIQQLGGTAQQGEHGLFFTLGDFTNDARTYEQMTPNLRLLGGQDIAELVFRHYDNFSPEWKSVIPLRRRYLPG